MKGYPSEVPDNCARARVEGVNASYKDLSEVCGVIRNKKTGWALSFLEKASDGSIPVLVRRHNKNLGHRRELGGKKGRYPEKAAGIVLKALQSAIANGKTLGLGESYTILAVSANKKHTYPRMAPKGRTARSFLETSRIEIILKGSDVPKGVSLTPPKKAEAKKEVKPVELKKEVTKADLTTSDPTTEKIGQDEKKEPPKILKEEAKQHEHKHEAEKAHEKEKKKEQPPHQRGEHNKR